MEKRLRLKNDIRELETMNRFLKECGEAMALPTAFLMSLNLVMEDAVSNIIFYAYDQAQRIDDAVDIKICREDDRLWIHLEDHGKPFDPTAKADPDISLSAEEKQAVLEYLRALPLEKYTVLVCEFANWADTAPLPCILIKR